MDPKTVEPVKGMALARLYQEAEMLPEARTAAERFLTSHPAPEPRFDAYQIILNAHRQAKDAAGIVTVYQEIQPPSAQTAASPASLAVRAAGTDAAIVAEAQGLQAGRDLIKKTEAMVPFAAIESRSAVLPHAFEAAGLRAACAGDR
jgi:hypothetical protein